jgi:phosphoribosylformylglycinamidine cyclo-ligase
VPEIFKLLVNEAEISREQAFNTFNMGIGMVIAVSPGIAQEVAASAKQLGEKAYIIGSVTEKEGVAFCG